MQKEIQVLVEKLTDKNENEAFEYADKLAAIGSEYVVDAMVELLKHEDVEVQYLAARALSQIKNNSKALDPLFEAINASDNAGKNGGLVEALSGFDISERFVDIFRLYLNSSFKVETMTKVMLDFGEFNVRPRTIRKAEKHWKHYMNNVKHDEEYELKAFEVNEILDELRSLFEEEGANEEG